jgi:uncharacterized protein (TIGR02996 family)
MTCDKAFLEAIVADPEDDAPRLIYADWLDEQGDGPRAEFIRVQCALARLAEEAPDRATLLRREKALLDEHGTRRLASLPAWVRGEKVQFRRGFVAWLTATAEDFLKGGAALCRTTPIDGVDFRSVGRHEQALADCPLLARLTRISVALDLGPSATQEQRAQAVRSATWEQRAQAVRVIISSPHLTRLTALALRYIPIDASGARVVAESPLLARLTALHLDTNLLTPEGTAALAASPYPSRLAELGLTATWPWDEGVAALMASGSLRALTDLHLGWNGIRDGGAVALAGAAHLGKLRVLDLSSNRIGDRGGRALAQSPHLDNLTSLDLRKNALSARGRKVLRERFAGRVLV